MTARELHARRRALDALRRAVEAGPDDFDHPGYETLEALADGRLPDADREAVEGHVAACRICAEDLQDLSATAAVIASVAVEPRRGPRRVARLVMVSGSLAAGLLLALWLGARPGEQSEPAAAPPPSARAASPRAPELLTTDERQIVSRAIAAGRLDLPADARALVGRAGTLLGEVDRERGFGPLAPVGTAVLSPRPRVSWQRMPGATGYTVAVYDERFTEVASGRVAGTEWTPGTDFPRAVILTWQITAHLPSGDVTAPAPPQPEARFRVLDARTSEAVAEQQSRLTDQPLALGILMARAGLLGDAAVALERAASQPAERESARALLASLRGQGAPTTTNPAQ